MHENLGFHSGDLVSLNELSVDGHSLPLLPVARGHPLLKDNTVADPETEV